ncbi:MAG: hypothetical protein CBB87_09845 [Micavibrio sp. TMED27]|nr:hypothetical protein [Micavibrio sp.]OUT90436.1 MAG: hypothetical protein CBB87_09845 [Micavibrio sp. TMED27]|tara:strand:- start:6186 stop:6851 length:666 start_codon:yes stop_codon:yes gene_type:complete
MDHKLFVFDWNGTIISDTKASLDASNECLNFYGAPSISMTRFRQTFNFPVLKFYEDNGVSENTVLERKNEGNQVFQSSYDKFAKNCRTRGGARELLEYLKEENYKIIILSNYLTDKIESHLERLNIRHFFDDINAHDCDGTTILQSTTKVLRLREYMNLHGFDPEKTSIIGDSMEEPEIAHELGLTSYSITGGGVSEARLKKAGATYLVHSLTEVKKLLVS